MEDKIANLKSWLGTGAINIFGLPMSGKDTQGIRLAKVLGAKFISSGMIIRTEEAALGQKLTESGQLISTNLFYNWVLPYLERPELADSPLILSSIGRWSGEENTVIQRADAAGHKIKAALLLNISEADVEARFEAAQSLDDRGDRGDDKNLAIFHTRLEEFRTKTMPVIEHYRALNLLITINGDQTRDAVFDEIIDKLNNFVLHPVASPIPIASSPNPSTPIAPTNL